MGVMGDTWKKLVVAGQLAVLAAAPSGCLSQAVIQSGDVEALPLLALTLPLDAIGAAIASAGGSSSSSGPSASLVAQTPAVDLGPDPEDWVGECSGPLVCDAHEHFVCDGEPGDCNCRCVVTPAPACAPATPYDPSVLASCTPRPSEDAKPGPVAMR